MGIRENYPGEGYEVSRENYPTLANAARMGHGWGTS